VQVLEYFTPEEQKNEEPPKEIDDEEFPEDEGPSEEEKQAFEQPYGTN